MLSRRRQALTSIYAMAHQRVRMQEKNIEAITDTHTDNDTDPGCYAGIIRHELLGVRWFPVVASLRESFREISSPEIFLLSS